jgi:hypothetical protein
MVGNVGFLALATTGCIGERWDEVSVEDEGDVCLYVGPFDPWSTVGEPPGTPTEFTELDPITVHYMPLYCFSSSCTRNIRIACDADVLDDEIVLHGTGSWEVAAGPHQECTADCGFGDAQCGIDPLDPGSYDVAFGDAHETLVVPSSDTICFHR